MCLFVLGGSFKVVAAICLSLPSQPGDGPLGPRAASPRVKWVCVRLDATYLCNTPLVCVAIALGAEEASVSTLWLQVTDMQLRVLQEKLYLERSE